MLSALLLVPMLCLAEPGTPALEGGALGDEGPLGNDTFLPSHAAAQEALTRGDLAWRNARSAGGDAARQRTLAFDAWRQALEASALGDVVRLIDPAGETVGVFPDPDRTQARRIEGVAVGVLRRLNAGEDEDRAAWRERFEPLARAALAAAPYDRGHLERIERNWPLTRAAGVAALRRADRALERGRVTSARTWLQRARRHAGRDATLLAAIEQRREAARDLSPAQAPAAWRRATELRPLHRLRLESDRTFGREVSPAPLGRTLRPGATALAGGGLAIQTPQGLVWLDGPSLRGEGPELIGRISLADFLDLPAIRPVVSPSAGGWPLLPAGDGRDLVLVLDRGHAGRVVREFQLPARGNHLVCLRPGEPGQAQLNWHLSDLGLRRGSGELLSLGDAVGLEGHFEFQPGPIVHEGTVFVQVRVLDDPTAEGEARGGSLYLCAFELAGGSLRYARFLTRAADLRRDLGGRNGARGNVPTSGMPLALIDGALVVGTNVGLVCSFDAADGRWLWGVRTRRRDADADGWPGSRAPLAAQLTGGRGVLVAPFDSDHLYALPLGPALGAGFFLRAPEPIGPMIDLVGGEGQELVFLGRDGRHRAVRSVRAGEDARSALYLGRGERFGGAALFSSERVLLASDRALYLFDRTRGDLLLTAVDLEDLGAGRGGTVFAMDDQIIVVGRDTVWVYAAE